MSANQDKYLKDYELLKNTGEVLLLSLQYECFPEKIDLLIEEAEVIKDTNNFISKLPDFREEYQSWYSESLVLIKLLLPDRVMDFIKYYEKPKTRKDITYENYSIEDCLQNLVLRDVFGEEIIGPSAAIHRVKQQIAILKSVSRRFTSSLFDIRQLVKADLFDSEIDKSRELLKNKFIRAAGAIAGVVLERHLLQVCENHRIKFQKKDPGISYLNDLIKKSEIIDMAQWRNIQYLGDIRNTCDHDKENDPTADQVKDLIDGTAKITKTLF